MSGSASFFFCSRPIQRLMLEWKSSIYNTQIMYYWTGNDDHHGSSCLCKQCSELQLESEVQNQIEKTKTFEVATQNIFSSITARVQVTVKARGPT
jgi:hypothetical protein